jgi:hypothetical protein
MTSSANLTTFEHRRRLLLDIIDVGPFGNSPLEVNADFLLENCFCDFGLDEWCRAVGVNYEINRNPIAEFRCRTTLIFTCAIANYETNASQEL